MSRWPLRYQLLDKHQLENELFALCLRLKRTPRTSEAGVLAPPRGARAPFEAADARARRCYVAPRHCADYDFPRLLEADERARALLSTLNETASLLCRLARTEAESKGGGRRLHS